MNNHLLTRLLQRASMECNVMKSKLKKSTQKLSLTLPTALLLITLTGCQFLPSTILPDQSGTGTHQGSGTGNNQNDSKYSSILNSILNDSSINTLIDRLQSNDPTLDSKSFAMHPYAFLASKGHNVSKIKSGELDCHTASFICDDEPNSLYMVISVDDESGKIPYDYIAQYYIKYTLTDQEMAEYKMLFEGDYAQAYFMNNAISQHKTAEVISQSYLLKETQTYFANKLRQNTYVTNNKYLGEDDLNVIMYNYANGSNECQLLLLPDNRDLRTCVTSGKIGIIPLSSALMRVKNGVYLDTDSGGLNINKDKLDEYTASIKSATIYDNSHSIVRSNDLSDKE